MGTLDETLFRFGIYPSQRGYKAVNTAVWLVQEHPDLMDELTTQLYPHIGHRCKCSGSTAEHRIRMASLKAWNTNLPLLTDLAKRSLPEPPSASEFVWILCRHISKK